MNLQHLRNARVLAKTLHFTKAAQEIHIVQPALSRQIRQLEEEVGAILFQRNKRSVELTPAGKYFFEEMDKLLTVWENMCTRSKEIHNGKSATLRIGFTHSIMQAILPEILQEIRRQFPLMKIILKEMSNYDQTKAIVNGNIDLSFTTHPLVPEGIRSMILKQDFFALLLPESHPFTYEKHTDMESLSAEEFIFPSRTDGSHYVQLLTSICQDAGFEPKVSHETDSATSSFRLVEAGMGVSIEPVSSLTHQKIAIKRIPLTDIPQRAKLTMMWSSEFEENFELLFSLLMEVTKKLPAKT
ncbi:MAG: LysR family transcriptional regulator [Bacteroidota bacterium]